MDVYDQATVPTPRERITTMRLRKAAMLFAAIVATSTGLAIPAHSETAGPSSDDEIDAILAPTVSDELVETLRLLSEQGLDESNVALRGAFSMQVNYDEKTLTVRYYPRHENAEVITEAVAKVTPTSPFDVFLEPVDFDSAQRGEIASWIMSRASPISVDYGLTPTIALVDPITGTIDVETDSGDAAIARADNATPTELHLNFDGAPVNVRVGVGSAVEAQISRNDDAPNWSGGISLDSGSIGATLGFTWQRWGTGELMGSTAEHAYQLTGASTWANAGQQVGTRYYYSVATDSALLRSSPLSQFSNQMYVGLSTTTTRKDVVSALNSLPLDTRMALNGRCGIRDATDVYALGAYTQLGGGPFVLTTSGSCSDGDSGGPWIQTNSAGDVIGAGTHVGRAEFNNTWHCMVSPLGPISAAMAASIYTG